MPLLFINLDIFNHMKNALEKKEKNAEKLAKNLKIVTENWGPTGSSFASRKIIFLFYFVCVERFRDCGVEWMKCR